MTTLTRDQIVETAQSVVLDTSFDVWFCIGGSRWTCPVAGIRDPAFGSPVVFTDELVNNWGVIAQVYAAPAATARAAA